MTGYIKDHRKELHSDIWLMPPMYHRLWQWLKYKVNYEDAVIPMNDGSKFTIKKGQHLTSLRHIAQGLGYYEGRAWKEPNPKTVSVILEWMIKTEMIEIERGRGNREYTLITLLNWEKHQRKEEEGNSNYTPDGEGSKQQADIKKKNKEGPKKKEEKTLPPQFEEFWSVYPKTVSKQDAVKAWSKLLKDGVDPSDVITATKNYALDCKAKGTEERYIKNPATFLNGERWKDSLSTSIHQSGQNYSNGAKDIEALNAQRARDLAKKQEAMVDEPRLF
jgi:hypothetical protein